MVEVFVMRRGTYHIFDNDNREIVCRREDVEELVGKLQQALGKREKMEVRVTGVEQKDGSCDALVVKVHLTPKEWEVLERRGEIEVFDEVAEGVGEVVKKAIG